DPIMSLLPEQLRDPAKPLGELLSIVKECAEQIGFLSRQLLGFRSDGVKLEFRSASIAALVENAASLVQHADVEIRTDTRIDDEIQCAPPLLVQVLANLI